jgi:opacity protein-like surface antigen
MSTKALFLVLFFSVISSVFAEPPDTTKPKKIYIIKRVMTIHQAPYLTLQLDLHYNQAMGQLQGTYNDDFRSDQFINGRSLGSDKGFGASFVTKIAPFNKHLRITISASYNQMLTYLFGKKQLADVGESKFNIYNAGLGLENNFTPNHRVKLYLGGEALLSMINGTAQLWVENRGGTPYSYNIKIKNSFRIGVAILGGAEYLMSDNFGFNLGFKLTHANLFLKEAKASGNDYEINLVDDASNTNPPVPYSGKKQIVFLSIITGIDFYWGISEKKYILPR